MTKILNKFQRVDNLDLKMSLSTDIIRIQCFLKFFGCILLPAEQTFINVVA